MRVLVIDDLRVISIPSAEVEHVRTSREAIERLESAISVDERFDEVWFDHDLGVDPQGEIDEAMAVVNWILERCVWERPLPFDRCVIHTSNPPAAETMVRSLGRYFPTRRVVASDYTVATVEPSDEDA